MNLKNKVVVITGASKGLGESLAYGFEREGALCVVSARSSTSELAKKINGLSFKADVTKEMDMMSLAKKAVQQYGHLDIWVNNAGLWVPPQPLENTDCDRVREMYEVNLLGTMYGSKAALSTMKQQHAGCIMNILSVAALEGKEGQYGYVASKFAADGFTKTLRIEAAQSNISVIAVYPGGMQTHLFDEGKPEHYKDFMDPAEVAQKIIFNLKQETPQEELILRRKK